ncbi:MAG: AzlD domain-containing protein [Bifidobacteriaceae bacterium]|jgi:hypothetical protein|nr:AzlD domain-containing protein [Bifidobacteriaceae bacterium]
MSDTGVWVAVVAGCGACLALKVVGAYIPRSWLAGERVSRIMNLVTVALLAGLLAVQTAGQDQGLLIDSRLAAVGVAAVALWLRAPFIVVIVVAAAVAAGLRALGLP